MSLTEVIFNAMLILTSLLTPTNPSTSQISLEAVDTQTPTPKIVFYNYSYVTYSSPFAMNYSEILFGDIYTPIQTSEEITESKVIKKEVSEKEERERFSFDWIIEAERKCNLPEGAKIEIVADETYTMQKEGAELRIQRARCSGCDITIEFTEYPQSIEDAKRLLDEGKANYILHKSAIRLFWKYSKTLSCIKNL